MPTLRQEHERAQELREQAFRLEDRLRTARKRLAFSTPNTIENELSELSLSFDEVDEEFALAVLRQPELARSQFDWTPETLADWVRRGRRIAAKETAP